jgi:hypothetical protein
VAACGADFVDAADGPLFDAVDVLDDEVSLARHSQLGGESGHDLGLAADASGEVGHEVDGGACVGADWFVCAGFQLGGVQPDA